MRVVGVLAVGLPDCASPCVCGRGVCVYVCVSASQDGCVKRLQVLTRKAG